MHKPTLAIAGASGFLGKYAIEKLAPLYNIKALCRTAPSFSESIDKNNIEWIQCDLFNLKSSEEALKDCDYVLYLIHSMMNGSRLTQSTFTDLDLIIADNISRASKKNNIKHIIYVGGILPEKDEGISPHLKSRKEVEVTLGLSGIPFTSIRAAIIIGSGGSSFQIIYKLVKVLPLMVAPKWTDSLSQPVDIHDVIYFIEKCIGNPDCFSKTIDIHGSELISYRDLIKRMAEMMGLKRRIFIVPYFSLGLSKLWLHFITGVDYGTISPLIDSLKYNLNATNSELFDKFVPAPVPLSISLKNAIEIEKTKPIVIFKKNKYKEEKSVRSVQRLILPKKWNAIDLANEYVRWLPTFFLTIIKIHIQNNIIQFKFLNFNFLVLTFSEDRSNPDRQLFYISGGCLVDKNYFANARFEFRLSPHEHSALAAIHDYKPALPWYLYRIIQANAHAFVMYMFNRHLKNIS